MAEEVVEQLKFKGAILVDFVQDKRMQLQLLGSGVTLRFPENFGQNHQH